MSGGTSKAGWVIGAVVVVIAALAGFGYWKQHTGRTPRPMPKATPEAAAPVATPPMQQHPISQAIAGPAPAATAALPALEQSDTSVAAALARLAPGADLAGLLLPQAIIPRMVATINALPERQVAQNLLPVRSPRGALQVIRDGTGTTLDPRNAARYSAWMRVLEHADARALVAWYVRNYPLFEQSYADLGLASGHFNDRLVFVIEQLLATPDVTRPVALKPWKSQYVFADPKLEALSAGQKMLIRSGAANEARIKAKLREIHQLLLGHAPAAATSTGRHEPRR